MPWQTAWELDRGMDEVNALRKWMQEGSVREPTDVYKSSLKVSVHNRYYTMMKKERSY